MPATQDIWVRSLGQEDTLEREMATHSILAWRIPWTEEPGGLQSMGSQRVGHGATNTFTFFNMEGSKEGNFKEVAGLSRTEGSVD